jgi:hypothetical protein
MRRWANDVYINGVRHNYNVNGFFIDDASGKTASYSVARTDTSDIPYAGALLKLAGTFGNTWQVVFNWGAPGGMLPTYVDCVLQEELTFGIWSATAIWVNEENNFANLRDSAASNYTWTDNYWDWRFVQLGYGYTGSAATGWPDFDQTVSNIQNRNAGLFFFTDQAGWGTPPSSALLNKLNAASAVNFGYPDNGTDVVQCTPSSCAASCQTCSCPAAATL